MVRVSSLGSIVRCSVIRALNSLSRACWVCGSLKLCELLLLFSSLRCSFETSSSVMEVRACRVCNGPTKKSNATWPTPTPQPRRSGLAGCGIAVRGGQPLDPQGSLNCRHGRKQAKLEKILKPRSFMSTAHKLRIGGSQSAGNWRNLSAGQFYEWSAKYLLCAHRRNFSRRLAGRWPRSCLSRASRMRFDVWVSLVAHLAFWSTFYSLLA
jgi:hypothetical protein